ncbi:MAG: trehalase family glycosidase [Clostridia bacterium]|nr:trehalase family glycosidase [Clostridia bacterium]
MSNEKKPTWIWYPGDFEIWLNMKVSMRRTERGRIVPPIWRMDTFYPCVKFRKKVKLISEEEIIIDAEGEYNLSISDRIIHTSKNFILPEGENELVITVYNPSSIPSVFVRGKTIISDDSWEVSCGNHIWLKADFWNFNSPEQPPSGYRLALSEIKPEIVQSLGKSVLYDFGKESFGYIILEGIEGKGKVSLYYGESREEAMASNSCELLDIIEFKQEHPSRVTLEHSRAFRFVLVKTDDNVKLNSISALYEYLPVEYRGKFKCSDEQINKIWDTSVYTLHLNTREFFVDGIKRDRWVWSGDAYQSFLMNYYSFFDLPVTKRTLIALRGKNPVETHINHIMDYSFYWFMGLYDYYLYTGDIEFIAKLYKNALGLMQFCLDRRNKDGLMENYPEDWVFVDWADMNKEGELSFEQLLLCRSLEIMEELSLLLGDVEKSCYFGKIAKRLKTYINEIFWDEEQGGYINDRCKGVKSKHVTKYTNMFAVLLGYSDQNGIETIKNKVLLNNTVQKIKTPYMRFYELAALCEIGEHKYVVSEIKSYWGGMLDLEATSFWEEYNPELPIEKQYEMYGRKFGKSLCHAWGASPIYLLGKYFLGVRPLKPGYEEYEARPNLGGLEWIEGTVPLPGGEVNVYMDRGCIKVKSSFGKGKLRFYSISEPTASIGEVLSEGNGMYSINIEIDKEVIVKGGFLK